MRLRHVGSAADGRPRGGALIPLVIIVIIVVVIPVCIAVLLGTRAFQGMTPLVFCCRRCNREFFRRPYRRFPTKCPLCHARNGNS